MKPGTGLPALQDRKTNHAKLWLVALFLAALLTGLAYAFFAEFERESWFSPEAASFLNRNELEVFLGGGIALAILLALVFYRTSWFVSKVEQTADWSSGPAQSPQPIRPAPRQAGFKSKESGFPTLEVLLQRDRRACFGDLVLTDQRLYFICHRDESLTKAVGGKAVASQFGLLGVLVHSLLSRSGQKRKQQDLEAVRRESEGLSMDARAAKSRYSMNLTPQEIGSLAKSWTGTTIEVGTNKYKFLKIEPTQIAILGSWCKEHGVATRGI